MNRLRSSSQHLALVYLTAACGFGIGCACVLLDQGPLSAITPIYIFPGLAALYAGSGLLAWRRRPGNRLGPLLVATGGAWLLSGLQNVGVSGLIGLGLLTSSVPLAMLVHLLHAAPGGRLRDRSARIVVSAAYLTALVLQIPLWAFAPQPPPFDVLLVSPRPDLAVEGKHLQNTIGGLIVLVTVALLVSRLRGYSPPQRRVLGPLLAFGILALLSLPLGGDILQSRLGPVRAVEVEAIPVALIPLAFLAVVLRGGFARVGELSGLVSSLAASSPTSRDLQDALGRALGDDSAQLLRWSTVGQAYLDLHGQAASPPEVGSARTSMAITAGDERLGLLVYDPQLTEDPSSVEPVVRVAGIALDRERLAHEAEQSRDALRIASSRLLTEADRERRRIVQDLHDGLQGSLVRLAIAARGLAAEAGRSSSASQLADAVDRAAADLRALVQGVMPATLLEGGLPAALQELSYTLPVRTTLSVDLPDRLSAPVESTAYFVVSEALTNVVKHAAATAVDVSVTREGDALRITVQDDGHGGATTAPAGRGLTGLRDRLEVLGGGLDVDSTPAGTRVEAVLPCAS